MIKKTKRDGDKYRDFIENVYKVILSINVADNKLLQDIKLEKKRHYYFL